MEPTNINIDQIAKQFCERAVVGSNNQFFILIPMVGGTATAYAITPEHAKVLAKTLQEHVDKFEKNFRQLPDSSTGQPSPMQKSDFSSNDGESKKK